MHFDLFPRHLKSSLEQLVSGRGSHFPDEQQSLLELVGRQKSAIAHISAEIQAQTIQLHQAIEYQAMLRRIAERVRDSLDETQILQTVVQELGAVLNLVGCDAAQYDPALDATVVYRYATAATQESILWHEVTQTCPLQELCIQRQVAQFCCLGQRQTILLCAICDGRELLGHVLLHRAASAPFDDLEVDLVQQVSNQCAIAIRQARLYQTSQAQVAELERLNQVKDDFLSTMSYELRVPIANMKMSIQMLKLSLDKTDSAKVARYLEILQNECDREARLIEDLLDLQQLDSNTMDWLVSAVRLEHWFPVVLEPWWTKFQTQDLALTLEIEPDLPALICDHLNLERVVTELLRNAHKYTPARERVWIRAERFSSLDAPGQLWVDISVSNTGVEIPAAELPRIFDTFYRVNALDRRRQGGTGLGLALVQKLVARLGGSMQVSSENLVTCFTARLPVRTMQSV